MKWLNSNRMRVVLIGIVAAIVFGGGGSVNADFVISDPVCVSRAINSEGCDDTQGCRFLHDGLKLYFAHNRPGGYGGKDIWVTSRETINDEWGEPVNLGPNINNSRNEAYPAISPDDLEIYFHPSLASTTLLRSTRASKDDPWGPTQVFSGLGVPACDPDFSADGLTVYFDSNRSGGYGGWDIWVATRPTVNDPWGEPVNLGPNINDYRNEYSPSISNDSLALFYHKGGIEGIVMATRATKDDDWGPLAKVVSVGSAPDISPDGSTLYFESSIKPGFNNENFWQVSIKSIVDFTGDGNIDTDDLLIMIKNWGTDKKLCDIGPMLWGDGVVDVGDLEVLMSYWGQEIYDLTLIAHWPLDEAQGGIAYNNASDCDGTLIGNPVWEPDGGIVGGALKFDGIDDYVSTDPVLCPANGVFSVFAWIKGGAAGQVILSQQGDVNWLMADSVDGALQTDLKEPATAGRDPQPPGPPLISSTVVADGDWHRVGFVRDGINRILYVDDVEVARDTAANLEVSGGGLYIGAGSGLEPGTFWAGLIDDVRIYNRAVSP